MSLEQAIYDRRSTGVEDLLHRRDRGYYVHLNGRAAIEDGGNPWILQPGWSDDRHAGGIL